MENNWTYLLGRNIDVGFQKLLTLNTFTLLFNSFVLVTLKAENRVIIIMQYYFLAIILLNISELFIIYNSFFVFIL